MAENKWVKKGGDYEETPTWNFKENASVSGVLLSVKHNTGTDKNSTIYTLKMEDGTKMGVWGSAVIDSRMEDVSVGEEIRIDFLGKETGKSGREYNNYDVFSRAVNASDDAAAEGSDDLPF